MTSHFPHRAQGVGGSWEEGVCRKHQGGEQWTTTQREGYREREGGGSTGGGEGGGTGEHGGEGEKDLRGGQGDDQGWEGGELEAGAGSGEQAVVRGEAVFYGAPG